MTYRTAVTTALTVAFGPVLVGLATPKSAPTWLLRAEDILVISDAALIFLALFAIFILPSRVLDRLRMRLVTPKSSAGEGSQETRIQVLDGGEQR